jgi:hypothetical protein
VKGLSGVDYCRKGRGAETCATGLSLVTVPLGPPDCSLCKRRLEISRLGQYKLGKGNACFSVFLSCFHSFVHFLWRSTKVFAIVHSSQDPFRRTRSSGKVPSNTPPLLFYAVCMEATLEEGNRVLTHLRD